MASLHALVVGNSDGIGLAFTKRLLAEGFRVTGISRRETPIVDDAYAHHVLDVASETYSERLRAIAQSGGTFDVCAYCAGIGELFDPGDLSSEARVFRVNLVGAVETAEVVLPAMIARRSGHFIGLSSIGDGVSAEAPSYAASKAGLSSYLGGLALALRRRGVRISNVRFGFVDTKMAKSNVKPMMISVDEAVARLMLCVERRPSRMTYPWAMNLLVRFIDALASVRLWLR
jgi:NAD(P)-dependent dehydrogenase (short-subunit alcohol dehydrogenase family)